MDNSSSTDPITKQALVEKSGDCRNQSSSNNCKSGNKPTVTVQPVKRPIEDDDSSSTEDYEPPESFVHEKSSQTPDRLSPDYYPPKTGKRHSGLVMPKVFGSQSRKKSKSFSKIE